MDGFQFIILVIQRKDLEVFVPYLTFLALWLGYMCVGI